MKFVPSCCYLLLLCVAKRALGWSLVFRAGVRNVTYTEYKWADQCGRIQRCNKTRTCFFGAYGLSKGKTGITIIKLPWQSDLTRVLEGTLKGRSQCSAQDPEEDGAGFTQAVTLPELGLGGCTVLTGDQKEDLVAWAQGAWLKHGKRSRARKGGSAVFIFVFIMLAVENHEEWCNYIWPFQRSEAKKISHMDEMKYHI